MFLSQLTEATIGAAIDVHRELGPGLLEAVYETCFAHELGLRGIPFEVQKKLPIHYKGLFLDPGVRLDMVVHGQIVVELKSVEKLTPLHDAQLLTYLRQSGCKVGLLINFNTRLLKDGIRRLVLNAPETWSSESASAISATPRSDSKR